LTRDTFHLVPEAVWVAADVDTPYEPTTLESDGFIHCTDGVEALGVTFDRFYAADPRRFLALTLDLDALDVPWRYDVTDSPYPHIYGPIRRSAVRAVSRIERAPGGRYAGMTPALG